LLRRRQSTRRRARGLWLAQLSIRRRERELLGSLTPGPQRRFLRAGVASTRCKSASTWRAEAKSDFGRLASVLHTASSLFGWLPFWQPLRINTRHLRPNNTQRSNSKRLAPVKPSAASQSASRDSSCAAACGSQRHAKPHHSPRNSRGQPGYPARASRAACAALARHHDVGGEAHRAVVPGAALDRAL
jgi:hypothetical protein